MSNPPRHTRAGSLLLALAGITFLIPVLLEPSMRPFLLALHIVGVVAFATAAYLWHRRSA